MNKKDFKGTKDWSNYYWFYYKWQMIGALFLAIAIAICTAQCMNKVEPDYYILVYGDRPFLDADLEKTFNNISKYGKDQNSDGKIKVSAVNCTFNFGDTKSETLASEKALLQVTPGGATIWLLDESGVKIYYEGENIDVFAKIDGGTSHNSYSVNAKDYKYFDSIAKFSKKDYYIFIKKDKNGKADKSSLEILQKLKK